MMYVPWGIHVPLPAHCHKVRGGTGVDTVHVHVEVTLHLLGTMKYSDIDRGSECGV